MNLSIPVINFPLIFKFRLSLNSYTRISSAVGLILLILSSSAAAQEGYQLMVSKYPDRSRAQALNSNVISDRVYIFVSPSNGIDRTQFYINNTSANGTIFQTENNAPFDFNGGSPNAPRSYNTERLRNGNHTISAKLKLFNGNTRIVTSSFTVGNGNNNQPEPPVVVTPDEPDVNEPTPPPVDTEEQDPESPSTWPSNTNSALQMSGIFYGQAVGGLQTGNARLAVEHSLRFRAEKSGLITAVRWENRILTQGTIDTRGSTKICRDNNLGPRTCGYVLGNAYHVGNGGKIVASIHPDNGNGYPKENTVLGKVAKPFIPVQHSSKKYVRQPFESPVRVTAGKIYHVRLKNLAPPKLPLYRNSVSAARAKDPNTGAMSLNGIWQGEHVGPASLRWGPYYGRIGQGALSRNKPTQAWDLAGGTLPRMEVQYADNIWRGINQAGYDNIHYPGGHRFKGEGNKVVRGNTRVRQIFTVRDSNRVVDGVWLNFGHTFGADLSPLTVKLKNSNGAVLARGKINASEELLNVTMKGYLKDNLNEANARKWGYTDLSNQVTLQLGKTYSVEFSAGNNAGFVINSFFRHTDNNRNEWTKAWGEVDKGDGKGWRAYSPTWGKNTVRDLPVMFTIEGMPKQLP